MFRRKRDEMFEEILARIDRNSEETRLYIRESGIRFERAMQAMERRMQSLEEQHERDRAESLAESREWRARIDEQTQGILKVLDRWGEGPPPEPAT